MIIKIVPNETQGPATKLANAELIFEEGLLSGLRLLGFSIWKHPNSRARTVSFPTRTFFVNGSQRNYTLLRPLKDVSDEPLKRLILQTYEEYEQRHAQTAVMPIT